MDQTERKYGNLPDDIGLIDIIPKEMLFWLYCPIKVPGGPMVIPSNLMQFQPIVDAVMRSAGDQLSDAAYVYLTAKNLWVTSDNPGNRPGWHSDGFLTDDVNFIWSDRCPTVFFHDWKYHSFVKDHNASLIQMDDLCESVVSAHHRLPNKHLLRLDETVLHKTPSNIDPGMRCFVKVSISKHKYALSGNSVNHDLQPFDCNLDRGVDRNCPIGEP